MDQVVSISHQPYNSFSMHRIIFLSEHREFEMPKGMHPYPQELCVKDLDLNDRAVV